ncbi:hypothetical protein MTP04_31030 [Lysinibacillus sp. PLM2]|nr:hypothetical protein MTP04_31030 [Lysinibacillus sp. PLM2]
MNSHKYTLDRYEGDYAIFLKRPDESEQLRLHKQNLGQEIEEGTIVQIVEDSKGYTIELLQEDTKKAKKQINHLINELKNKNK